MSSEILGALSEEEFNPSSSSSLSGDEEVKEECKEEVPGMEVQPNLFASFLQPPALPPMQFTNEQDTQQNEPTENDANSVDSFNLQVATAT